MKPKIAIFSGPTATIHNSEPLVTSNKARAHYGLPLLRDEDGDPLRFDVLRPQRLAAPVKVYIEQFSAHPLEQDACELYAPPDGYLDGSGIFHRQPQSPQDKPVYEVILQPEDGLYPLPYMARQANGSAWEDDCAYAGAPPEHSRQPFYPDASRIVEEIDRLGYGHAGIGSLLSSRARFAYYRAAPPGGYKKGLPAQQRTDVGTGDILPERMGQDFFPYRPRHLAQEPSLATLAHLTNVVAEAMADPECAGGIWLEGSPSTEETTYWLNLLIDTTLPIVGNASQRPHGAVSNDGDRNIIDSVTYILSKIWADETGKDQVGGVMIQEEQIFAARDVQKGDARPGGYVATGGHGGIIGTIGDPDPATLTYLPNKRHTHTSLVNLSHIPLSVLGTKKDLSGQLVPLPIAVKDEAGKLLATAIPKVTLAKYSRYQLDSTDDDIAGEVELMARLEKNLQDFPLAGFVVEGKSPYGRGNETMEAVLEQAAHCGMPVVKVGRGNADGFATSGSWWIGGSNLTATKARLLLMACLLRFGSLPVAQNPTAPTPAETAALKQKVAIYQEIFNSH
ncbi:MAG: asparaginase domain-containing protein [Cyanobacteriota bacterium]|nr:asparaginase domain-containing protein [Cyanobacteriota bacterium]